MCNNGSSSDCNIFDIEKFIFLLLKLSFKKLEMSKIETKSIEEEIIIFK